MRNHSSLALILLSFATLAGCDAGDDPLAASDEAISMPPRPDYFVAERDRRACPAPLCGGFFISAPNRPGIACPDGTFADKCHVSHIELAPLELGPVDEARVNQALDAGVAVLRGTLVASDQPIIADSLIASEAWLPADHAAPHGQFLLVHDTGARCVTAPCYFLNVFPLNQWGSRLASRLDWQLPTPPTSEDRAALLGDGILVTGSVDGPPPPHPLPEPTPIPTPIPAPTPDPVPPVDPAPQIVFPGAAVHVAHHYLRVDHQM